MIDRINKLNAHSQPQWGKMKVAQMLAHLQQAIGVAEDSINCQEHYLQDCWPNDEIDNLQRQTFKRNLPADKSFVMTSYAKDFEKKIKT